MQLCVLSNVNLLKNLFAQLNGLPKGRKWRIRDHSAVSVCPHQLLNCLVDMLYVQVNVHRDILRINNQQNASSIQILFSHETLHVSGIFCAHRQELPAVHVAIGMFLAGYVAAA